MNRSELYLQFAGEYKLQQERRIAIWPGSVDLDFIIAAVYFVYMIE